MQAPISRRGVIVFPAGCVELPSGCGGQAAAVEDMEAELFHSQGSGMSRLWRPAAGERAREAAARLRSCRLCAFECGADRTAGPAGACRADSTARVFQERIDWGGEERLAPTLVVNLSGCNMRCSFCITGSRSQNAQAGVLLRPDEFAERLEARLAGLRSLTIEGGEPAIHLGAALEIAARVPPALPVVWKTNAYASDEALDLLDGTVDLVLADYKFGSDACAQRLARVPRYTEVVRRNLLWARGHSTLIVRHLLMPGHYDCCFLPVARWMAEAMPEVPLSLMTGFLPHFRAARHPELNRLGLESDAEAARAEARRLGLTLEPWVLTTGAATGAAWPPTGWKPADGDCSGREPSGPAAAEQDQIWIDRTGRVCVGFASAALSACLARLADELSPENPPLTTGRPGPGSPFPNPCMEHPSR